MQEQGSSHKRMAGLCMGALGVVYGDIGTSPLYSVQECFKHISVTNPINVLGIMSLIFWSLTAVVSLKYVVFVMRADNKGEGGVLALMALALRALGDAGNLRRVVILAAIFGAALFYGDSVITPAISVISAIEGMEVINKDLSHYVVILTIVVLIGLFVIQRSGTAKVGKLFGPIMVLWFIVIGVMGLRQILRAPQVLRALNPWYGLHMFIQHPALTFIVLGSVVLAVTGGEALYADMGHFGSKPIRAAWFALVKPALVLNYFGQGALLLSDPTAIDNPFYKMVDKDYVIYLLILATAATVIASQAVISGAYSMSQQAVQLGFSPRMKVMHTSAAERGQIYMPAINWILAVSVILLVIGFKSSDALAAAYGIAVTGTMAITTVLAWVVMWHRWRRSYAYIGSLLAVLALVVDLTFFSSNMLKIASGGWFPLLMALAIFILLTTWKRGREVLMERLQADAMPLDLFIDGIGEDYPIRVPGTAVFMTSNGDGVPHALLHNLKHNKVLHERVVLLTVITEDIPYVTDTDNVEIIDLSKNFFRMTIKYGFKDEPEVPAVLEHCQRYGLGFDLMDTSFFLSRETLVAAAVPGMAVWREKIFVAMSKNAQRATEFFKIPTNRVVELGSQVEL